MLSSMKRFTAAAGITCAIVGAGPVAIAAAAPASAPVPVNGFGAIPSLQLPNLPGFPGQSCSVNQGLFPGFINLGPTGPLGPLGPKGPLGNTNNNLPCGADVFNLGPTGPLGPGGALGPGGTAGTPSH
jgi:hypothetical protein